MKCKCSKLILLFIDGNDLPLKLALEAIKTKKISVRGAARLYRVSKNTLYDYGSGKKKNHPVGLKKRSTSLTENEERAIAEYLKLHARSGYALRKIDLKKAFLVCIFYFKIAPYLKKCP